MPNKKKSLKNKFDAMPFLLSVLAEMHEEVVLTDADGIVLAQSAQTVGKQVGSRLRQIGLVSNKTSASASLSERSPSPQANIRPVSASDGTVCGYLVFSGRRISAVPSLDPLTGVADRSQLEAEFQRRSLRRDRRGESLSLIFIDLDDFKPVNDSFGHWVGDQILMQFACLLQNHFRSSDLIARYGGDEFVVLCSDCAGETAAQRIAAFEEKLVGRCVEANFPGSGEKSVRITLGFSYGIAETAPNDTFATAVQKADAALYGMKNARAAVLS